MVIHTDLPREDVNYSKEHPLKNFFRLLTVLIMVLLFFFLITGLVADYLAKNISPEWEKKLGRVLNPMVSRKLGNEGNIKPQITQHVNQISQALMAQIQGENYSFDIEVLCSPMVNAFALPGGKIYILSGLLKNLKNESELALLIGHEMAHVIHRDAMQRLGRGILAGVVWVAVAGSMDDASAEVLLNLGSNFLENKFSREQEKQADRMGMQLLYQAGFDLESAPNLYLHLEDRQSLPEFLSTHPASGKRDDLLIEYARENGWTDQKNANPLPAIFQDPCN